MRYSRVVITPYFMRYSRVVITPYFIRYLELGGTCDGFELDVAVVAALGGSHLDDPYLRAQDRLVLVERNYTQLGVLDEIFGRRKKEEKKKSVDELSEYLCFSMPSDHGQLRDGETQTRASHRISHDPKDYLAPGVSNCGVFTSVEQLPSLMRKFARSERSKALEFSWKEISFKDLGVLGVLGVLDDS
ncbi:hypothetical protein LXL04_034845 [Taraxacum kok-saghyz]